MIAEEILANYKFFHKKWDTNIQKNEYWHCILYVSADFLPGSFCFLSTKQKKMVLIFFYIRRLPIC